MSRPESSVIVDHHGGVAVLTFDNPRSRNVLTEQMVRGLNEAMNALEADNTVRCVVVTGAGAAFCAGAEFSALEAAANGDFDRVRSVYDGFLRLRNSPLPTIAAVNGPAVGAGFNVALACDLRMASTRAVFDSRFSRLHIHPGGGHAWMLSRLVGTQLATLGCLFGEEWTAAEAARIGLTIGVWEPEDLIPAAVALGRRLDGHDPTYVRRLVATLRSSMSDGDHATALAAEAAAQEWSTAQPAFRDALRAIKAQVTGKDREPDAARRTVDVTKLIPSADGRGSVPDTSAP